MTIFEYADTLNLDLTIIRYSNQQERWAASFANTEMKEAKESSFISSAFADGNNPNNAIENLIAMLTGNILVINPHNLDKRQDLYFPRNITLT